MLGIFRCLKPTSTRVSDENGRLVIEGRVVKVEMLSNRDGSVNRRYVVKPRAAEVS